MEILVRDALQLMQVIFRGALDNASGNNGPVPAMQTYIGIIMLVVAVSLIFAHRR